MALMYGDGAMFLGNSKDTNEQHSLIGTTIRTAISILASANLATILANNDTVLTSEITMASSVSEEGVYLAASILANNDTVLTTSITAVVLSVDALATIAANKTLLTISITEGLDEPAIKDITPSLAIIDSTDTYVESRTETEVI